MNRGTDDILNRLSGVESRPRALDRDARRGLMASLVVTAVSLTLAWTAGSVEPGSPADDRSAATHDPVGALERLRVDPESIGEATSPSRDGYETIDAIGPGRRT